MAKLLLFFVPLSAFAAPTVTIIGTEQESHSSVSLLFTYSNGDANVGRGRLSPPNGSCTSGSGGIVTGGLDYGGLHDPNRFPYDNQRGAPQSVSKMPFAGLRPDTSYQICVELSSDGGSTWSSGVGYNYHTKPLPAVHPADPIPPAQVDTTFPDTTGYVNVSPSSCSDVRQAILDAQNRQLGTGTVINLPDCDNTRVGFPRNGGSADNFSFQPSGVSTTDNTIGGFTYPGDGSCGSGNTQVPCLSEGMGVRFENFFAYNNTMPDHLHNRLLNCPSCGVVPNIFYVHFPSADHSKFQIFFPKPFSQCPTCLWTLGDQGSGNGQGLQFQEWPKPPSMKAIVLRTPTPDAQFLPLGTRVWPAWDSKMAHWRNYDVTSGYYDDGNQSAGVGPVFIVGVHFSYIPYSTVSPSPVNHSGGISVRPNDGPFIFDRCWVEGPLSTERVGTVAHFDGAGTAFINGRIDKMYSWHAQSTWQGIVPLSGSGIVNTTGTRSFTIGPGRIAGGAFNYAQAGTMHVTMQGTPSSGKGAYKEAVYVDPSGDVKVMVPPGMESSTTDIGSIVTGYDDYDAGNDLNSIILPKVAQAGQQRPGVMPIAFFDVLANGNLNYLAAAEVQESSMPNTEGSDTIINSVAPGPTLFDNNFFSWNGNLAHFDDGITGHDGHIRGDSTFRRNYFLHDYKLVRSSPDWDYNLREHRQGIEWKGGSRDWVIGNLFVGPNGCDNQNPTGTAVLAKTPAGDANDINIEYNTVYQGCGFTGAGAYLFTHHMLANTMSRVRVANNLLMDVNGWRYGAYSVGSSSYHGSAGWFFQNNGPIEDYQIIHNTFLDHDGLKPAILTVENYAEGFAFDNNLFFYAKNPGSPGAFISDQDTGWTFHDTCASLSDKALLDCAWPGYSFRNNVIVPGNNSSNIWAVNCDADRTTCLQRESMTANAQVDFNTVCTAFGGTVTNGQCTGGLPSFVLPYTSGVAAAYQSLKMYNPTKTLAGDYHLRNDSPIISGGTYKGTDGKDVGADIEGLAIAQGAVTPIGTPANSVTSNSATLVFIAPDNHACPVDISSSDPNITTSFTRFADTGTSSRVRNVQMTGLTAGTKYFYRIDCAVEQPTGNFKTKPF